MSTSAETEPTRKRPPPDLRSWWPLLAGLLVGCGLLVPSEDWIAWFHHPLRTAPDAAPPEATIEGVGLLRWVLPAGALAWVAAGLLLIRHRARSGAPKVGPVADRPALHWPLLAGLLVVAFAARLPLLEQSLWYDEIVAFWYYGQHGPGPIIGNMFTPANHIMQSLGSWAAVTLSGGSLEGWVLRLPALLAGLLCAWPMLVIGRRALGRPGALIATALILLMPIALAEGTEARGYALMLLFATSASALLLVVLEDRRVDLLPIYALVCALGVWSHLVTVVVPIAHGVLLLALMVGADGRGRRPLLLGALGALVLAAVTTLVLMAPVIPDLLNDRGAFAATGSDQPTLGSHEGRLLLAGFGGTWPIAPAGLPGAAFGAGLLLIGVVTGLRDRVTRLALLLTGLPIVVAVLLVLALGTWIYARFVVFNLPLVALGIGAALIHLHGRSRALGLVAAIGLLAGWSPTLLSLWSVPRQPVRELVALVPDDGSKVASAGIRDMSLVIAWYLPDARARLVNDDADREDPVPDRTMSEVEWVIHAYPNRSDRWPAEDAGGTEMPGWIDGMEGTMRLLRRAPGQS